MEIEFGLDSVNLCDDGVTCSRAHFRSVRIASAIKTDGGLPALLPPAHRAQTSASAANMSTSFPLPSSPHWDPKTTWMLPAVAMLGHG